MSPERDKDQDFYNELLTELLNEKNEAKKKTAINKVFKRYFGKTVTDKWIMSSCIWATKTNFIAAILNELNKLDNS